MRRIALQSAVGGMALSLLGALAQEMIGLVVVFNACGWQRQRAPLPIWRCEPPGRRVSARHERSAG